MKTRLTLIGALAAACAAIQLTAMPTEGETRRAEPVVKKLLAKERVALKSGKKTHVEVAESAMELAKKEDFEATLAIVNELKDSTNAAVRLRCVESIGWFGGKSAKVLESFLADPDRDIRSEAQDQWDSAVNDIEDDHERGVLVESAMTLVRDRDVMDTVATQLNDLPPSLAIDIIVHVIGGSNGVARVAAKKAYEFVTGDDWKGATAAQKWLEENQEEEDK